MRKLILTADDYGLNPGVNLATLESVRNRTVTSVQVLVNLASDYDIKLLAKTIHEAGNTCGIGLHLCTTVGPSVLNKETPITTWSIPNQRYEFVALQDWSHQERDDAHIIDEMNAQFKRLKDLIGSDRIDAISSHQNIHLFYPPYLNAVEKLAIDNRVPVRSPVRWEQDKLNNTYQNRKILSPIQKEAIKTFKVCPINTKGLLWDGMWETRMDARRDQIVRNKKTGGCPETMCGHWFDQPEMRAMEFLASELAGMNGTRSEYGAELLMHLSTSSEGDLPKQNYSMKKRKKEYEQLNSPAMKQYIQDIYRSTNVLLGSYRKVLHGTDVSFSDFAV